MQRLAWMLVLALAGCGEVQKNLPDGPLAGDGGGDAPPPVDAPVEASAVMRLQCDDPPEDGALDSAGSHVTTCPPGAPCPRPTPGVIAGAYAFSGQRLVTAAASDLQPGTAFTLMLWARVDMPPAPSLGNAMIACKNLGDLDCSFALSVSPALVPQFYTSGNGTSNLDASVRMTEGQFHHLAARWDGAVKTIFVDGAASASGTANAVSSVANGGMTFGQRQSTTDPLTFVGAIDEVMFFPRALTDAEVKQLATP